MRNQSLQARLQNSSRKKMQAILKEEEEISEVFNISNFYQNQRLNIRELKLKLEAFKRKKAMVSPFKKMEDINKDKQNYLEQDKSTAKFAAHILPLTHENNDTLSNIKKKLNFDKTNPFPQQPSTRKERQSVKNSGFWKPSSKNETEYKTAKNSRQSKIKTAYNHYGAPSAKEEIINSKQLQRKRYKAREKSEQSKYSDSSFQKSFQQCNFEGKITLSSQTRISQFQRKITQLWSHYQLVTRLLISLREEVQRQKPTIAKYITIVCSSQFQFLKQLLEQLCRICHERKEIALAKRLKKAVTLSRLYENMAIFYLSMFICLGIKSQSNLSNFIGYSTSNITFVIKLLVLLHRLEGRLCFSEAAQIVIETIAEYERGSYGRKINLISEVVLRMQQNNEVIAIVNNKLCRLLDGSFQEAINDFLKNVDLETKSLSDYAHHIFQFLASHLAQNGIYGKFLAVQIAPAPYHPFFPKPRTLVVQPWEVFFAYKGNATYLRAHAQTFLTTVGQHWNLVYWTDLMPKEIEGLLNKLPQGLCLYRYHCKLQRGNYVKLLDRIGCDINNTVIIDRCEDNFKYHREHGISMPWKGYRRDLKLLQLLQLLRPLFLEKISLRSCFGNVRSKLAAINSSKKGTKTRINTYIEQTDQQQLPKRIPTNHV